MTAMNGAAIKDLISNAGFVIGAEDHVAAIVAKHEATTDEATQANDWADFLASVQIRLGTLLKTDSVSVLIGAGASLEFGGPVLTRIPRDIEKALATEGAPIDKEVAAWLNCFYLAIARLSSEPGNVPTTAEAIFARASTLNGDPSASEFAVNFESLLSLLHRWRSVLPESGGDLHLPGVPDVKVTGTATDECIRRASAALASRCVLPGPPGSPASIRPYHDFIRKLLTRPLNLRRVSIFSLNYDTLVEQAADAEGIVLVDGFIGTLRRTFRPEVYDQDLYFPAQTTEGRVHRLDKVLHLYKLHGSITWTGSEPDWDNPYGVVSEATYRPDVQRRLIYPTPAKYGETLGLPYAELFRRFAAQFIRPQSTLFIIGYSFGDDHVNAIIRQALTIPSVTLVIVSPRAKSSFVNALRERADRRILIFTGKTFGTFTGFVRYALPDLRDEEVRERVMGTYKALAPNAKG